MAHLALETPILLYTSELRPSAASLPSPRPNLCLSIPQPISPGFGHAEYHPQSFFATATGHSTPKPDQWLQHTPLDGGYHTNSHLRALLA